MVSYLYPGIPSEHIDVREGSQQGNNSQLEPKQSPMHTVCSHITSGTQKLLCKNR